MDSVPSVPHVDDEAEEVGRLRCLAACSWSSVLHPLIKACPASEGHCILESPVQMTNMAPAAEHVYASCVSETRSTVPRDLQCGALVGPVPSIFFGNDWTERTDRLTD